MQNLIVRKGLVVAMIVLFMSMSIIPSTATNSVVTISISTYFKGNTLYVGGNGPNNYTKIQDAIDNASKGDSVFVFDDSSPYNERPVIQKPISLIGENRETTVLNKGVSINFYGTIISGFTIQNAYYGIYVWATYSSSNLCTIKNNIITQNEVGILLADGNSCIITNNKIIHNRIGIEAIYSSQNIITRNLIKENSEEGIFLEDSYRNTISKNNFIDNRKHAGFLYDKFSLNNRWRNNYWGEPTSPPKIISGIVRIYYPNHEFEDYSWENYDWNPAKEPFDIYAVQIYDLDDYLRSIDNPVLGRFQLVQKIFTVLII